VLPVQATTVVVTAKAAIRTSRVLMKFMGVSSINPGFAGREQGCR
jgi:hypothetical protein